MLLLDTQKANLPLQLLDLLPQRFNRILQSNDLRVIFVKQQDRLAFSISFTLGNRVIHHSSLFLLLQLLKVAMNLLILLLYSILETLNLSFTSVFMTLKLLLYLQKLTLVTVHSLTHYLLSHLISLYLEYLPKRIILNLLLILRQNKNRLSHRLLLLIFSLQRSFKLLKDIFCATNAINLQHLRILSLLSFTRARKLYNFLRGLGSTTLLRPSR